MRSSLRVPEVCTNSTSPSSLRLRAWKGLLRDYKGSGDWGTNAKRRSITCHSRPLRSALNSLLVDGFHQGVGKLGADNLPRISGGS